MAQGIIEVCMMLCLAIVRNVRMIYKSMLTNDIQAYSDTYNKKISIVIFKNNHIAYD